MGYDPVEEFSAYGDKISDLHVKDRLFDHGPVPLGKGNADILKVFLIYLRRSLKNNLEGHLDGNLKRDFNTEVIQMVDSNGTLTKKGNIQGSLQR